MQFFDYFCMHNIIHIPYLTLSWRRPISYRNLSIDLLHKSMDWFQYDIGLRHESVKYTENENLKPYYLSQHHKHRKSMDWFLYDIGLRDERVKYTENENLKPYCLSQHHKHLITYFWNLDKIIYWVRSLLGK